MNKYIMVNRNEIFLQEILEVTGMPADFINLEEDMRQYKVLDQYESGAYVIHDEEFGHKVATLKKLQSIGPVEYKVSGYLGNGFVSQKYAERMALFNQILSGDVIVEMGV